MGILVRWSLRRGGRLGEVVTHFREVPLYFIFQKIQNHKFLHVLVGGLAVSCVVLCCVVLCCVVLQ